MVTEHYMKEIVEHFEWDFYMIFHFKEAQHLVADHYERFWHDFPHAYVCRYAYRENLYKCVCVLYSKFNMSVYNN